ncbi:MAG: hypothetical protein AAB834_05110, partial [Patescibacteria group bacterium]
MFISNFPTKSVLKGNVPLRLHAAATLLLAPLTVMPSFISSVGGSQSASISTGSLYPLFLLYVVFSLTLLVAIARRQYVSAVTHSQKQQVSILFAGVSAYAILAVASNVVLPVITGSWSSSRYGPLFTLVFVATVGFAVVKRQLFDIKFAIVRSLGYVLSLLLIGVTSFAVLRWASVVFDRINIRDTIQINLFVVMILVLAVSYQPFKRLFDRLTNKLFYRDAYDTQVLLNEFNQVIVSTIILEELLERASRTVEKFIKPLTVSFIVRNNENELAIIPSGKTVTKELIGHIDSYTQKSNETLFVTDTLEEDDLSFKHVLQRANIGMLSQINTETSGGSRGYILL